MKILAIILLAIRISGSPSPAESTSGFVELSATDCATEAQEAWDAHEILFQPFEVAPGDTAIVDTCAMSSTPEPTVALPSP